LRLENEPPVLGVAFIVTALPRFQKDISVVKRSSSFLLEIVAEKYRARSHLARRKKCKRKKDMIELELSLTHIWQ